MTAQPLPALASGDPSAWDQALYAFLVEKGNRSGSKRTVESYSRMLWPFFADRALTPDRAKPADVLAWVHGIGRSGRTPSSTTVGARIACLSSFYRFLIRMGLVVANPCDAIERPRAIQSVARGIRCRRGSTPPRCGPRHRRGPTRPGDPADPGSHRPSSDRGHLAPGRGLERRRRDLLLRLPGQGRQARSAGTPPPRLRGDLHHTRRRRQGAGFDGPGGVTLASSR